MTEELVGSAIGQLLSTKKLLDSKLLRPHKVVHKNVFCNVVKYF